MNPMLPTINLRNELVRQRSRQKELLDTTRELLVEAAGRDRDVLSRLKSSVDKTSTAILPEDLENVFSLEQIRNVCIRYRLRFLDSKYFKSEYPYEAIVQINAFEKRYGIKIESFKIIAPDHLFDLENINKDPLLFAELSDGRYYLLHKWGNDLKWSRGLFAWPIQNFKTYFFTLLALCFAGSFLLPTSLLQVFNLESEIYLRLWFGLHLFIGFAGISLWLAFSYDKRFSDMNWNSKYYNF